MRETIDYIYRGENQPMRRHSRRKLLWLRGLGFSLRFPRSHSTYDKARMLSTSKECKKRNASIIDKYRCLAGPRELRNRAQVHQSLGDSLGDYMKFLLCKNVEEYF